MRQISCANHTPMNDTIIAANSEWKPSLACVYMKTRLAKFHLQFLEAAVSGWIKSRPYTVIEEDDFDAAWHYFIIEANGAGLGLCDMAPSFSLACVARSCDRE